VADAILDGSQPPVHIADVIENLRVLDAARLAGATRTTVTLDPPAEHGRS
jgi:hypothetical protein